MQLLLLSSSNNSKVQLAVFAPPIDDFINSFKYTIVIYHDHTIKLNIKHLQDVLSKLKNVSIVNKPDPLHGFGLYNNLNFNFKLASPFDPSHKKEIAFYGNSRIDTVPMMYQQHIFECYNDLFTVVKINLLDANYYLLLIKPNSTDLNTTEILNTSNILNITSQKIIEIEKLLLPKEITLFVPKIHITFNHNINDFFKSIGVTDMFKCNSDFNLLSSEINIIDNLNINTLFSLNECEITSNYVHKYTTTNGSLYTKDLSYTQFNHYYFDKPFLIVLKHINGNIILSGCVSNIFK